MVRREPNGNTLYYIDSDGIKQEFNPMEGTAYSAVVETQDKQISSVKINRTNKGNYMTALDNAQISEDAGRPYPTPTVPQMCVVPDPIMDEYGVVTPGDFQYIDWVPPLPTVKKRT